MTCMLTLNTQSISIWSDNFSMSSISIRLSVWGCGEAWWLLCTERVGPKCAAQLLAFILLHLSLTVAEMVLFLSSFSVIENRTAVIWSDQVLCNKYWSDYYAYYYAYYHFSFNDFLLTDNYEMIVHKQLHSVHVQSCELKTYRDTQVWLEAALLNI